MVRDPLVRPDIDELLGLLADSRRRTVLELLASKHSLSLTALADAIVQRERQAVTTDDAAERTERVRLSLHHNHLPKLADANLISYEEGGPQPWATLLDSAWRDRVQVFLQKWSADTS